MKELKRKLKRALTPYHIATTICLIVLITSLCIILKPETKKTPRGITVVSSKTKDIDKTHPYTATEVIKKIKETLELSLGPNHKFTSNKFQDICKRKGIKNNQDYCYQFPYSKTKIYKYSDITIEYISQVYIEEFKK